MGRCKTLESRQALRGDAAGAGDTSETRANGAAAGQTELQADGGSCDAAAGQAESSAVWKGVALMGAAVIVSKVIGTLQKIPLQNIAGDRVFGIYNAVYPFYQLFLVLATAGFPVAVSLLVAERIAGNDRDGARHVLGASTLLLAVTGAAGFVLMWSTAELTAGWIGDAAAAPAIRMSSLALWSMPVVAALRGYYQGLGRMLPTAASQLLEQTVRVAAMLALLAIGWRLGWTDAGLAAGAAAGSAVGGLAALAVMAGIWRRDRRMDRQVRSGTAITLLRQVRRLAVLAFPVAMGALVVPVLGVVDAFTVPRLLHDFGYGEAEAMAQYGVYSRGQPIVQLVVMVAGAIGAALVPALVAARARGEEAGTRLHASSAMRAAWWIGAAAAAGIALLAGPMNMMLYADNSGTLTFALIGCTALAGTVNAIAAAVLQGLGAVRAPALFMLAAAALKAALNAALVPALGIAGAACAGIAALTAAALLAAGAVRRACGAAMPARSAAGLGLALAVMAAALVLAERGFAPLLGEALPPRAAAAALALGGTALGAALFIAAGLRLSASRRASCARCRAAQRWPPA
ncbi:polysaccharide biosynthesis protein [Paenibacillus spongiae]|uniref:Polysaccharide biosynthesis protein n=1 Tax=Paenibacillus spongiae TaxID=2909671 RepID=A0ABY5SCF6_9BACL|nr:polysaccharide biosynthesis protein [Paenibacillus spongiae]UVI30363.1 polysaccharide biosynthesis protein [Paenibacillus spongiae]